MKLPKFLFDRIKEHNSSLGNNEAFPPEEDLPFDYKILKNRFNEVCENMRKINIKTDDFNEIRNYLGKLLQRCKEIEEPIRPNLIKLCESWVNNQLGTPMETIILNCELVNEIKPNHAFRLMPESSDMRDFDFEDLNDFDNVSKVILKRRLINALIQGVSYNCNKYGNIDEELKQLNEELPNLYNEISIINDYLLFTQEEKITDIKPRQGACVEVMLGSNGEKTEINVQGLIFPYLLQETFRGFFELFASHGLPEDNNKANYILRQADFLLAEPWDIRMGVGLWNILSENIDDPKILPFFFTALCEMPVEEFNENLREVFAKTKRGKQFIQELIDESMFFVETSRIIYGAPQKNYNSAILNDEYISSDELDDYVLTELDDTEETQQEEQIDYANLLISCSESDIDFIPEEYNDIIPTIGGGRQRCMYILHVTVNGVEIPTEYVYFRAEGIPKADSFQLHINVDDSIRRKGIAFKLYQAFIRINGSACSLLKNRTATFYDENNTSIPSDIAIGGLWDKLGSLPNIEVIPLRRKGEIVGFKAIKI